MKCDEGVDRAESVVDVLFGAELLDNFRPLGLVLTEKVFELVVVVSAIGKRLRIKVLVKSDTIRRLLNRLCRIVLSVNV